MNFLLLSGVIALGYWVFTNLNKPKETVLGTKMVASDELRKKATKVKVEFEKCEIRDYSYFEEVKNKQPLRVTSMNVLSGDEMSNVKNVATNRVVLIYHHTNPANGEKTDFSSGALPMDKDSLQMNFIANDIFLFFDPMDPENYFFEFLPKGN